MTSPTQEYLRDTVLQIQAESGGLVHLSTVLLDEAPALLLAAAWDPYSLVVARACSSALQTIRRARDDRDRPPLCACCPRALVRKAPFNLAVVVPASDKPEHALAFAICTTCAATKEILEEKAVEALRNFWPDSQTVEPTHENGGRA